MVYHAAWKTALRTCGRPQLLSWQPVVGLGVCLPAGRVLVYTLIPLQVTTSFYATRDRAYLRRMMGDVCGHKAKQKKRR